MATAHISTNRKRNIEIECFKVEQANAAYSVALCRTAMRKIALDYR